MDRNHLTAKNVYEFKKKKSSSAYHTANFFRISSFGHYFQVIQTERQVKLLLSIVSVVFHLFIDFYSFELQFTSKSKGF